MSNATSLVLDVMRVPPTDDPRAALLEVDDSAPRRQARCEVLVVGGGTGGVAAAWAAARRGRQVCLLEETDWLGGQMTSQGISALDEHEHIEAFGGTRTYYQLRNAIRDHYRSLIPGSPPPEPMNPGACWVTRLSFEPLAAVRAVDRLLAPEVEAGRLQILLRTKAVSAEVEGDRVVSLDAVNLDDGTRTRFRFDYVLDATELGDLLPMTGAEYVVGAESVAETREPHAQPVETKAHCVQSCTYAFAMERRPPGENNRIREPDKYDHYRRSQPYSLRIHVHGGEIYGEESGWLDYHLFEDTPATKGPVWKYRRLVEAAQFPGRYDHDVTMFNWPGNDYRDMPLVDKTPYQLALALQDAKRVSLGFAYWLQTQVSNPNGTPGFPNLLLRPDVMGTEDGLAKCPYIREGRRIKAVTTVVEQHVAVAHQPGPRSAHFNDSVGIGWYPIAIHRVSEDEVGTSTRTKPFQIPLGSLIPVRLDNLIAAGKNIGVTHITNGRFRLHPVEWNVGESAGALAAFALQTGAVPKAVHAKQELVRAFQEDLIEDGVPVAWLIDVPVGSPYFSAAQRLVMAGGYGGNADDLEFRPHATVDPEERAQWIKQISGRSIPDRFGNGPVKRATFAAAIADHVQAQNRRFGSQ